MDAALINITVNPSASIRVHPRPCFALVRQFVVCFALAASLGGCATTHEDTARRVGIVEAQLNTLLGHRDDESRRVAEIAVRYNLELARKYDVQPPAVWHNFLINIGARKRGLCCHWTRDLMDRLKAEHLTRFDLHWGVAHYQTPLEHNTVVVTPIGGRFDDGLILDGWRHCGDVYVTIAREDSFPWKIHPLEAPGVEIICTTGR